MTPITTTSEKVPVPLPSPVIGASTDNLIQQKLVDETLREKCNGGSIGIIGEYTEVVGGERLFAESIGYSARGTKNYQSAMETKWGCPLPFTAQIVSVPILGKSFGLSFEYLDMFKVVIGDGDRKSIRVEQNKWNNRKIQWPIVKTLEGKDRATLINPIEDNEEVTLIIKAKYENEEILLEIKVLHSKFQSNEKFQFHFKPTAVNFGSDQSRRFRVGINDSKYEGDGSIIDLQTISIKEGGW